MGDVCLVTGGAGFIGSHLVEGLLNSGREVRVLDNFSTGSRENLEALEERIELIEGDIRDEATLARAVGGVGVVYHEAALARVQRSIEMPLEVHDVNCTGTLKVLLAARDGGVRRVIFASSSSVYGDVEKLPKEETDVCVPISPYGASKLSAEVYAHAVSRVFELETVGLRYFNVFGPRQNPAYAAAIPAFIERLLQGKELIIHGDGEQTRDFTYVGNVVSAPLLAAEAEGEPGSVFNIAGGGRARINELAESVSAMFGVEVRRVHAEPRAGDIKHSIADIAAARRQLGYRLEVDFENGLRRTVEWFKESWRAGR